MRVFFVICSKGERSFSIISTNRVVFPTSDLTSSIAAGLGWSLGHIFILYGLILTKSIGPGTYFRNSQWEDRKTNTKQNRNSIFCEKFLTKKFCLFFYMYINVNNFTNINIFINICDKTKKNPHTLKKLSENVSRKSEKSFECVWFFG